jgi:preprotein translocase subunit SecG
MLYYLVAALFVINCLVLMFVILLQQGKGGDIASAFGGGSSQAAFGARSGATVLSRATTVCAVLFVVGAIALGIVGRRRSCAGAGGTCASGSCSGTSASTDSTGAGKVGRDFVREASASPVNLEREAQPPREPRRGRLRPPSETRRGRLSSP